MGAIVDLELMMCVGVPGRIVDLNDVEPHLATVEVRGVEREINIGLIEPEGPRRGDWVDVHLGMALAILDEEEARAALDFLTEIEEAIAEDGP